MLKEAFGDNAVGQTQTCEWFKLFKNSQSMTIFNWKHDRNCGKSFGIEGIVHK
jgi:hypothetical protein